MHRMMLAYTNGCESYVPLDRDFALGGYEAGTFPDLGSASLRVPASPRAGAWMRSARDGPPAVALAHGVV